MLFTKKTRIGVGLYSIADAARILNAPSTSVHRWVSADESLFPRYFDPSENVLTFAELMELHFIKMFRDEGVSLQTIHKASSAAAQRFETDYPFSAQRFDTDGKTIFATLIDEQHDREVVEDLQRGQYVFGAVMRPFFRKLQYDAPNSAVSQFWPRGKRGQVVLDPLRKFGKPIDAQSGIPTQAILDAVNAGRGQKPAVVARWLGISVAAVQATVAFERSLAA
jgi:hypothetical protein